MTTLLHIIIALSILISTTISGNPNIVCSLTMNNDLCPKQIIEKPKRCCACKEEKEIERSCKPVQKSNNCGITTAAKVKDCCQCSFTPPLQSAVLSEQKPSAQSKTIALFKKVSINTSDRFASIISKASIPNGIHNTISSTILLL